MSEWTDKPVRFSIIDYLNALPLNLAFKDGLYQDRVSLAFDYPSMCADNLASNRADVGLISSIEYQRIPNLKVAPGICIASRNEVRSVLIITKCRLRDIKVMAVDRFSRSSTALLRLLLKRRYDVEPRFVSMTPDSESMLANADAALIIGDAAFEVQSDAEYEVRDLAGLWFEETGLPFVFAFWAMRPGGPTQEICRILNDARAYGKRELMSRLPAIRERWLLSDAEIRKYFDVHIHYELGDEECESLRLFYAYASETNVIGQAFPIRWAV